MELSKLIPFTQRLKSYLNMVALIAIKDLRSEARGRAILAVWAAFGLLIFLTFYVSLNVFQYGFQTTAPTILWVAFAITGTMSLTQSYNQELEYGGWHALLMSPMDHSAIYFGKLISNLIVSLIAEIVIVIGFSFVYDWPVDSLGMLLALLLGTVGFVSVGTLAAAFVIEKRGKELLLPLMVLPVIIPVIALAGQLTSLALTQSMTVEWGLIIIILLGYDIITVFGAAAAFSLIAELY